MKNIQPYASTFCTPLLILFKYAVCTKQLKVILMKNKQLICMRYSSPIEYANIFWPAESSPPNKR